MTFDPGVGATRAPAAKNRQAGRAGRGPRATAFIALAVMVAAMWILEGIDTVLGGRLDAEGVQPLNTDGLTGILFAPLLHAGWGHLIANTVPLLVVGAIIALSGIRTFALVTAFGWAISGAVTWLIGGGGVHIGASGVVFAYIVFVIVRGLFTRAPLHIIVGIVAAIYYGVGVLGGMLPFGNDGISWQGHLGGAIGGVAAASTLGRRGRKAGPRAPITSA